MKIRKPFDKHYRVQLAPGKSRTQQSFKAECDINEILRKAQLTGLVAHVNNFEGDYGDYTGTPQDYHEAQNQVIAAQEAFLTLPSGIRKQFDNDPGRFLAFVSDPANRDKMREMGLLAPERPQETQAAPTRGDGQQPVEDNPGGREADQTAA